MSNFDDENKLLKQLGEHDSAAVETIYKNNFAMIQAFILKSGGYGEDARDIFQESLIVLFENSKSPSFELTCTIRTYLYSVCRRLWLKKIREEKRLLASVVDVEEEVISVDSDMSLHEKKEEDFNLMNEALEVIGEPCKSILKAFYIDRKSMPEIASEFGYTNADNAKTQKYKCLMRLKKIFFSQYKNEE